MTRLTWRRVSVASQIMLPSYAIAFTWLGVGWLIATPREIAASAALSYLDTPKMPLAMYGLLLVVGGAMNAAALAVQHRELFRLGLMVDRFILATLTVALMASSLFGDASFGAPALAFLATMATIASDRSLLVGERTVAVRPWQEDDETGGGVK